MIFLKILEIHIIAVVQGFISEFSLSRWSCKKWYVVQKKKKDYNQITDFLLCDYRHYRWLRCVL